MARPTKATVEYFPLDCDWGDSLKIIENKFGNDGFVLWVKLLQKLGRAEQHVIDCRNPIKWELLYTEMRLNEQLCMQILDKLAELGCINELLWKQKIIYSENFIKRISDAYKRRSEKLLSFDNLCKFIGVSVSVEEVSACNNSLNSDNNPQREIKGKGNKKEIKLSISNEIDIAGKADDVQTEKISYQSFINLFNEICLTLPKVKEISPKRKEKIKSRWKEKPRIDFWEEVFRRVEKSDFLTGRSGAWKNCSFDWLIENNNNYIKVYEGVYDNKEGGSNATSTNRENNTGSTKKSGYTLNPDI